MTSKAITLSSAVVVACNAQIAFDFVADPHNDALWLSAAAKTTCSSTGPIAVGTVFRQSATFLGIAAEVTWRVTCFEPATAFEGESTVGPISVSGGYRLVDLGEGRTSITKHAILIFPTFSPIPKRLLGHLLQSELDRAMRRLAGHLRARAVKGGPSEQQDFGNDGVQT